MTKKELADGFSAVEALIIIVIVAVLGASSWVVWRHNHQSKKTAATSTLAGQAARPPTAQPAGPYAEWKTYCDPVLKACYKYPGDWNQSQYGGYQNATDTAYFDYQDPNAKDQAANSVYIAAIENLNSSDRSLKIVGYVLDNVPTYAVYDASVVTASNLTAGQTAQLVTGNPTFTGKTGTHVTFMATPGAGGIAAITSTDQARAWFTTPGAGQSLKILQSFYYQ